MTFLLTHITMNMLLVQCRHGDICALINAIVNNALYIQTHASNRFRLKSFTSCAFCGRLAATDFVMKCIEARAVRWPEVWKFYMSLSLH